MPTGYTAGILDGTINTFDEFAKKCIRAFGAAMHMRDDAFDKPYEPRKVANYYTEAVERTRQKLLHLEIATDEELLKQERENIQEEIERSRNYIIEAKRNKEKLEVILEEAKKWNPPTTEHDNFKSFMIEQLQSTIDQDGKYSYYEKSIKQYEDRLNSLNVEVLRGELIQGVKADLSYYQKNLKEETDTVNESNKWAEELFNSLRLIN